MLEAVYDLRMEKKKFKQNKRTYLRRAFQAEIHPFISDITHNILRCKSRSFFAEIWFSLNYMIPSIFMRYFGIFSVHIFFHCYADYGQKFPANMSSPQSIRLGGRKFGRTDFSLRFFFLSLVSIIRNGHGGGQKRWVEKAVDHQEQNHKRISIILAFFYLIEGFNRK